MTESGSTLQGFKITEHLQSLLNDRRPWIKKRIKKLSSNERKSLADIASETSHPAEISLRVQAISVLAQLGEPGNAATLARIVENSKEDMRVRALAVAGLGYILDPQAEEALVRSLSIEEDLIRIRAIQALGRIGTPESLGALQQMPTPTTPAEDRAVKLATNLIVFRNDLESVDQTFTPGRTEMPSDSTDTMPVSMQHVGSRDIAMVREALEGGEYGISVYDSSGIEIICGKAKWVVLLNAFAGGNGIANTIEQRKMVLGLLARYVRENQTYSVQHILLTRPAGDEMAEIMVFRSDGTPCYSGIASVKEGGVTFSISDIERPGTAPVMINGFMDSRGIRLDSAVSSSRRINKQSTAAITR